jgi:hypothetical protein
VIQGKVHMLKMLTETILWGLKAMLAGVTISKDAHLMAALNEFITYILHSISTGAKYRYVMVVP